MRIACAFCWTLGLLVAAAPGVRAANGPLGNPRVMHGPMVGAVTPTEARLWVRLSGPFEAVIEYATRPDFADVRAVGPLRADKAGDYILQPQLTGLAPGTRYHYRVLVEGEPDHYLGRLAPFSFRTAPAGPARFRVAFGSCFRRQITADERLWRALAQWEPDLFFWTGDNVYGDAHDPDILAEEYRRARDLPALATFIRGVPQVATWDDHDFGLNNGDRRHPSKAGALRVFTQYWANPPLGMADTPGAFFRYSYGGVDFFFLDGRYHRDPVEQPDGPDKTFLGAGQFAWLKAELRASGAPFKVLICGTGWSVAKGPDGDSWAAFRHERDALFDFLRDERIGGVVLVSGDSHVGELNCIPWSQRGGYDLVEVVSSPLAQNPVDKWLRLQPEVRLRPVFSAAVNFGVLDFDLTGEEPVLRANLVDADGSTVWAPLELRPGDLANGVESWTRLIDRVSLERQRRAEQGGPYYR